MKSNLFNILLILFFAILTGIVLYIALPDYRTKNIIESNLGYFPAISDSEVDSIWEE